VDEALAAAREGKAVTALVGGGGSGKKTKAAYVKNFTRPLADMHLPSG
jgi:hypothetical protein